MTLATRPGVDAAPTPPPAPKRHTALWVSLAIAAVLALAGGIGAVQLGGGHKPTVTTADPAAPGVAAANNGHPMNPVAGDGGGSAVDKAFTAWYVNGGSDYLAAHQPIPGPDADNDVIQTWVNQWLTFGPAGGNTTTGGHDQDAVLDLANGGSSLAPQAPLNHQMAANKLPSAEVTQVAVAIIFPGGTWCQTNSPDRYYLGMVKLPGKQVSKAAKMKVHYRNDTIANGPAKGLQPWLVSISAGTSGC